MNTLTIIVLSVFESGATFRQKVYKKSFLLDQMYSAYKMPV